MGCDIHMHYEIKNARGWWPFGRPSWKHHNWRAPHVRGTYEDGSINYDHDTMFADPLYVDRNYDLFAVLAGVRNYHNATPISAARGLPTDVTPEVRRDSDKLGSDVHSHSWLSLLEVTEFDYDRMVSEEFRMTYRDAIGARWFA